VRHLEDDGKYDNSLAVGGSALTVFLMGVLVESALFPHCTHLQHPICHKVGDIWASGGGKAMTSGGGRGRSSAVLSNRITLRNSSVRC